MAGVFGRFSAAAKMRDRARPLLEPDEVIEFAFPAIVGHRTHDHQRIDQRIIAVTDRAIVVMDNQGLRLNPVRVRRRVPRQTRLGPLSWKNNFCDTLGEELTIDSRWFGEVRAADAAVGWHDD